MGEQKVSLLQDDEKKQRFMRSLLDDIQAMEYMLDHDWFESGVTRIGAEQEMVLVDRENYKPAPIAVEMLEALKDYDWVTSELAKFNLEINLSPTELKGDCFDQLIEENRSRLLIIDQLLAERNAALVITGVLPTLRKTDVELHNLTPLPRYKALMDAISSQHKNEDLHIKLEGIDELIISHNSPLIEACNTSFQVHLQVSPKDFVQKYNLSQALAGPIMAIAANSPMVFGKRLWHESRIALFQQSLDTRGSSKHMRERSPRVQFGNDYIHDSILDIYREDIARYRALLSGDITEDAIDCIKNNRVPKLKALQVHNSTVYRWNRPCYGISDNGKPHLRIENRVFAAGPTVVDEVANAALWIGAVEGYAAEGIDVRTKLAFADIRENFEKAAKFGIDSHFNWFNDQKISATDLILKEILPIARKGLLLHNVAPASIDLYLGVIEARAREHMNGARWTLRAYSKLVEETNQDEALSILTCAMIDNVKSGDPVSTWDLPKVSMLKSYQPTVMTVSDCMTKDLFTVQKDDIIQLAADLVDWRKIRYLPVEDEDGHLVGLLTSRTLIRFFAQDPTLKSETTCVEHIMIKNPTTIGPEATIMEAMNKMKENRIGCLPVVAGRDLIGIITERDFLKITSRLMERLANS